MSGFHDASQSGISLDAPDYLIVGSGAGGGAAARALARAGARVVVLEEGPYVDRTMVGTIARESMLKLCRAQGKQAAFGRATTPILQGRCVGGTTFINSAIVWRIPEKVIARWKNDFGLHFDGELLDRAYRTIEEEMSESEVQEGVNSNKQDLLLREGARKLGIEGRFLHRYEKGCRGSGRCLHGCPNDAKQSTTINYLTRAAADGASIFSNAEVKKVVIERGRAKGVIGKILGEGPERGRSFRLDATKAVIVCASAVQSPALLMRSGVRHPELGARFMAHPGTTVMGMYRDRVDMWTGASQGYEVLGLRDSVGVKLESINVPPEVVAARFPGAGPRLAEWIDRLPYVTSWAVAIKAEAEGRVSASRLFGAMVSYSLLERDIDKLRKGMRALAEMHFAAGAVEVIPGVYGLPEVIKSVDEIKIFDEAPRNPQAYSMVATHLFGGARAGKDPNAFVVDENLKVNGVESLYVMDASIFPSNTGVNPQHSIMALATVAAQKVAA
jgi:choline dehydrogenase-like flavoprotein